MAYLKISVNAVPEKGKANKELIKFLAQKLQVAASLIEIVSGTTEHLKKIYFNVPQNDEFAERLNKLNEEGIV